MLRTVYETNNFRRVVLFETEIFQIVFVECKYDRKLDNIKFIKMGNQEVEPEKVIIYRWQDENTVNDILKRYGAE